MYFDDDKHILENNFRIGKRAPKNPKIDDRKSDSLFLQVSVSLTLAITIIFAFGFQKFENDVIIKESTEVVLQIENIPETEQVKVPPPPAAPAVPVESENEELLDDITIDETDIDFMTFDELPPPPSIEEISAEEIPPFLPIENQPKLIGGLEELYKNLVYPELAVKAGIEGTVVFRILINKEGIPSEFEVVKSLHNLCDNAALVALKTMRFSPATQRDKPVPYRIMQPIRFKIDK
ncbi:MAG: energy transducer TonB [bacterium]|nr:energy transducer TonB [bacterium]